MVGEKRYFTVAEANELVPALEVRFGKVMQLRAQLRSAYDALERAGEPPTADSLERSDGRTRCAACAAASARCSRR